MLTHPRARGRGLARAVGAAAAREALSQRPVVQYRAWRASTASLAVAVRAGFTHFCDGLIIDLDQQPTGGLSGYAGQARRLAQAPGEVQNGRAWLAAARIASPSRTMLASCSPRPGQEL